MNKLVIILIISSLASLAMAFQRRSVSNKTVQMFSASHFIYTRNLSIALPASFSNFFLIFIFQIAKKPSFFLVFRVVFFSMPI